MRTLPSVLLLLVSLTTTATTNIADITGLGNQAKNKLWFHFNGNKSESIQLDANGNPASWTAVDKDGSLLENFKLTNQAPSTPESITYNSSNGSLTFTGSNYFKGKILAPTTQEGFTVFWKGSYDNYTDESGDYVFNIDDKLNSQREPHNNGDDSFSEFYVNDRGGTRKQEESIKDYIEEYDTVWATVYEDTNVAPLVTPYVNGEAKPLDGAFTGVVQLGNGYDFDLSIGCYQSDITYDFEGQISQLLIFNHVLEASEIEAVTNYLEAINIPEPSSVALIIGLTTIVFVQQRRKFSK